MRAHAAAGPAAHRAAITMFVPHGHPAHRAGAASARAARGPTAQWLPVRGGLPAALAAAVCALTLLTTVLLGAVPGGPLASASQVLPWQAAAPAGTFSGAAAGPAVPGVLAPAPPAAVSRAVVLPAPQFIRVPSRIR